MTPPHSRDDDAPSPRRRRALSSEERALWDGVAKQVKPLRKTRAVKAAVVAPAPLPPEKKSVVAKPVPPAKIVRPKLDGPKATPQLAPFGRRERSQLSRGRKDIEARIDLHGLTQAGAHRALLAFLHRASQDGMTFVLVITGKGRSADDQRERGILRRQVPLWFALPEFRALVVGYDEAGIGHGGEGALYVRLRRAR